MNEEELLKRSAEEREKIFKRYELGRAEGAEIDPWEDPAFEVYHTTDRLGFIHSERLPSKPDPYEEKKIHLEMGRTKKWLKMLSSWDSPACVEKLHKRIYKGIPNMLRSQVWLKLLKVEEIQRSHPNTYRDMFRLARLHSTDARQIDSDVNRQFREHVHYRERYNIKQQMLFNVLTAYAMYNAEVGYCQGMSGLAGVLLMYMDEEQAFWALHVLLSDPKYAMHGLYKEGFPKLTRFLEHHDRIFAKFIPKLKRHFDKHGLDAILYSLKWYFVCFVERVPFHLCLRIWDIYFLDGERVILAMAYTILKLHKKKLMKLNDMDSITNYLQAKLYKDFQYDEDTVVTALERSMEELRRAQLDLPGPPTRDEIPTRPFGTFIPAPAAKITGIRAAGFTAREQQTSDIVQLRSDTARRESEAIAAAAAAVAASEESHQLSVGGESVEHGTDQSCNVEEDLSLLSLHSRPGILSLPTALTRTAECRKHYYFSSIENEIPLHPSTKCTNISIECNRKRRDKVIIIRKASKDSDCQRSSGSYLQYSSSRLSRHDYSSDHDKSKGSKFSFDPSMDDGSSLIDGDHTGSRRSLADTSVTSTADLSVFSTMTRSQLHENSLDTHSNVSDNSVGGGSSVGSGIVVGHHQTTAAHRAAAVALVTSGANIIQTPRATPIHLANQGNNTSNSNHPSSPDVLRIYVPYSPMETTPIVSPQNGDAVGHKTFPGENNRIRIRIDTTTDELSTPIVEHGQIKAFPPVSPTPDIDLK